MPVPILAIATALAQFAPTIVKWIAGDKAGDTAQEVVDIATSVTGASSPEEALQQLTLNQEAQLKFKAAMMDFECKMEELYMADRADARKRETEIVKATGQKDVNLYVLAWTVVLGFFVLCIALMKIALPQGQNEVVFMLFGALAAGFGNVLQYFFGSSRGSAHKSQTIESALKNGGKG